MPDNESKGVTKHCSLNQQMHVEYDNILHMYNY